jgi:hypothetical protein
MKRLHLFESVDLPWCPQALRDGVTDWVAFMYNSHGSFNLLAPKLRAALEKVGTHQIVDLCSGGGGPWLSLAPAVAGGGQLNVLLTDLYPNQRYYKDVIQRSIGYIRAHTTPVDATEVPAELDGLRTIMSGFHHFKPEQARGIIADAVQKRKSIAIFEGSDNRVRGVLLMTIMPLLMLLFMPFVKPFRWSRLLLTYVVPVLPLISIWDGSISMLRTYSPQELWDIVRSIDGYDSFDWDIGTQSVPKSPLGLTYLIATPR